jgi:hypothetical protein
MLLRFAVMITVLELLLTAAASVLVTYTEPPPAFATENDLRGLGLPFAKHRNRRWIHLSAPCYETNAELSSPPASLYVNLWTQASATDFEFRRAREEVKRDRPELGESVIINEPLPGEEGYALRFRGPTSVKFELVRRRRSEILVVRVERHLPLDNLPSAELAKCERRARSVQEHLMFKMRWRD